MVLQKWNKKRGSPRFLRHYNQSNIPPFPANLESWVKFLSIEHLWYFYFQKKGVGGSQLFPRKDRKIKIMALSISKGAMDISWKKKKKNSKVNSKRRGLLWLPSTPYCLCGAYMFLNFKLFSKHRKGLFFEMLVSVWSKIKINEIEKSGVPHVHWKLWWSKVHNLIGNKQLSSKTKHEI